MRHCSAGRIFPCVRSTAFLPLDSAYHTLLHISTSQHYPSRAILRQGRQEEGMDGDDLGRSLREEKSDPISS